MHRHRRGPTVSEVSQAKQPRPPLIETSSVSLPQAEASVLAVGFSRDRREAGDYTFGAGSDAALVALGVDGFELLQRARAKGSAGEMVALVVVGFFVV